MEDIYYFSEVGNRVIWLWIGGGLRRVEKNWKSCKEKFYRDSRDN